MFLLLLADLLLVYQRALLARADMWREVPEESDFNRHEQLHEIMNWPAIYRAGDEL